MTEGGEVEHSKDKDSRWTVKGGSPSSKKWQNFWKNETTPTNGVELDPIF